MIQPVNQLDIESRIEELIKWEEDNYEVEKLKTLDESDRDEIANSVNEKMEYGYDLDTAIDENIDLYLEKREEKALESAKGYLEGLLNTRITDKQIVIIRDYFGAS